MIEISRSSLKSLDQLMGGIFNSVRRVLQTVRAVSGLMLRKVPQLQIVGRSCRPISSSFQLGNVSELWSRYGHYVLLWN